MDVKTWNALMFEGRCLHHGSEHNEPFAKCILNLLEILEEGTDGTENYEARKKSVESMLLSIKEPCDYGYPWDSRGWRDAYEEVKDEKDNN